MTATLRRTRGAQRAELIGLGALLGSGFLLMAVGARWFTGVGAILALTLVLASIVFVIVTAVAGGPAAAVTRGPLEIVRLAHAHLAHMRSNFDREGSSTEGRTRDPKWLRK